MRFRKAILSCLLAGLVGLVSWRIYGNTRPIWKSDVPFVRKAGIEGAMEQSRVLMKELKASDWNFRKVNHPLLFLPDHASGEFAEDRRKDTPSFVTPMKDNPDTPNLAFYSRLYFRANNTFYRGDKWKSRPEGFFIVGYKTGEVAKVPGEQVRLLPSKRSPGARVVTFPGMPNYDSNAEMLPYYKKQKS